MAAMLKIHVASTFFLQSDPKGMFLPNVMLVSQFERFGQKMALICSTITGYRIRRRYAALATNNSVAPSRVDESSNRRTNGGRERNSACHRHVNRIERLVV